MVSTKLKPPLNDEDETVAMVESEKKTATLSEAPQAKIDQVGVLSYITFAWIFEYLWSAYKGRLVNDQPWLCSIFDSANVNTTRLEHLWNEELKNRPSNPSLFRVVFRFMRFRMLIACLVFLFCLIFGFVGPTCLVKGLISYSEKPPRDEHGNLDYVRGLYLIFGILAVEISRVLAYGATWAISYRSAIRVRGAVLSLLYKSLLNSKSLRSKNSAEIVNIFGNDGQRIFDAVSFAPLVLMGPLVIVGGIIYLLRVIGVWSLLGLAVFVVFDVLQVFLGITLVKCRRLAIKNTEERLHLMGEILKNIKLIKMNCWEELFTQKVNDVRDNEKRNLRYAGYAQSIAIASGTIVPVVATIVTVLAVVYSGSDLLASDVFSAVTVFFVMLFGIRMIPYGLRYLGEAYTALNKIQSLLLYNKFEPHYLPDSNSSAVVLLKNACFSWDMDPPPPSQNATTEEQTILTGSSSGNCLSDLNLVIDKREKIAICGSVGSGKTALLNSILGATVLDKGTISVAGSIAYASQQPCIINTSIRNNILFEQQYNPQRYEKAIAVAELNQDIENMPAKDLTEVAERGAALSGGQKARLALARCFYSNRDIYLLDDVLGSINKEVADSIFKKSIKDLLASKTVLMVSSNPEYLAELDRVVFLANGSIQAIGSHTELLKTNEAYKDFFQTNTNVEKPEETALNQTYNGDLKNGHFKTEAKAVETYKTKEEDLGLSSISADVYLEYIKAGGGYIVFGLILLLFIANVGSGIFSTVWLSKWMKDVHGKNNYNLNTGSQSLAENQDVAYYSTIYIATTIALFVTGLLKAMVFVALSIKASSNLHDRMLKRILHGVVTFFDNTPTGQILNRFSKDLDEIDVKLPFSSEALLQYMITCIGFILTIIWVFPVFLLAFFPLALVFVLFFLCFRAGIRSLKRTENISRSPLFDYVALSLDSLTTIHAFNQNQRFFENLKYKLDENSSSMFMYNAAMRWQAVWLDLLVVTVSFIVSCLIVLLAGRIEPSDAGMALAFALQMSGVFQFAVRSQTELESKLTAVERVSYYYKNIEQEAYLSDSASIDNKWPSAGGIKFDDIVLRYRSGSLAALNHINLEIVGGEKVGIFGRTGSGKSSMANTLYRLYPLEKGVVWIDGVDISKIGLQKLRKSIAIIPQESGLFSGTLRFNLDPANEHTDDQLWESLEKCGLKNLISNTDEKLSLHIDAGGKNLSSGQHQLVCLARALLRNVRLVILDEATSILDIKADEQIQSILRETFNKSTVLLISHRTENVLNLDKVVEIENGKIRISSSADNDSSLNRPSIIEQSRQEKQ